MMGFKEFDNVEDMFDYIDKGVTAAREAMTPEQAAITYGDYWMRVDAPVLIFGHIYTKEEFDKAELDAGASEEELEYEHKIYENSYNNGFRFGWAYSAWEPAGELGDTHVLNMIKITKEQFEEAKRYQWEAGGISRLAWFQQAIDSL